jgi:acetolactate synthase I/II/III large subunit
MTEDEKTESARLMTGADIVVKTLESHNINWVFGVPGAKIDKVFDTLADSSIKTIVCRHEQNAAFIAGGIGRMTCRAGVALVTSGPGVSNLVTGLATANTEGDPILALGGAVAVSERLKQTHQTMNSVDLCKAVTKFSAEVDSPASTSEILSNAFRAAETGRPGAAFVSLPTDIMSKAAECNVLQPAAHIMAGPADQTAIEEAARLINGAKKPVVLLGLLASRPENAGEVQRFIRQVHLPVVGTFQASGAVSHDLFENFGGRVGILNNQPADQILDAADLVITIGYDAVEYDPSFWNKGKKRPVIHIDALRADIDNHYNPEIELIGAIHASTRILSTLVSPKNLDSDMQKLLHSIVEDRDKLRASAAAMNGYPIHPLKLISALQKILTSDVTLCSDMGSFHIWLARYLYSFRVRQLLISNGQQTLGVALPWAIAATLVRPSEKVLSISGDGGFLFSGMELETAVRLQSHLVHMIWMDGTYDMVAEQEIKKYGRSSGTQFGQVDPVKYAEAFGARGFMIRSIDEIDTTLKQAFDTSGPVLIGVHVDYSDNHKLFEQVNSRIVN